MDAFLSQPWPWWLGAVGLASVATLIWVVETRLLGVSGSFSRMVTADDAQSVRARELLAASPDALDGALLRATIEEFGEEVVGLLAGDASLPDASPLPTPRTPLPRSVHIVFLAAVIVGGLTASLVGGNFALATDLGATYAATFGDGWAMWSILFVGGISIGFGTRMSGGCTSGHGLVGCSRLVPASLVATTVFFGTAIAVTLMINGFGG